MTKVIRIYHSHVISKKAKLTFTWHKPLSRNRLS
jgi:hypothetical protein